MSWNGGTPNGVVHSVRSGLAGDDWADGCAHAGTASTAKTTRSSTIRLDMAGCLSVDGNDCDLARLTTWRHTGIPARPGQEPRTRSPGIYPREEVKSRCLDRLDAGRAPRYCVRRRRRHGGDPRPAGLAASTRLR